MKKALLMALVIATGALFTTAEAAKKDKKAVKATPVVEAPVVLTTSSDSLSYAAGVMLTRGLDQYIAQSYGVDSVLMPHFLQGFLDAVSQKVTPQERARLGGVQVAHQLEDQMLAQMKKEFTDTPDSVETAILLRGFTDAMRKSTTQFTTEEAVKLFSDKQATNKAAKEEKLYGANREKGKAFLAENAKKDSVITTPSGLQYKVLVKGTGVVPQKTDRVSVNYEGRLINGTVFDASKNHGDKPATFRADQVIKGWTEALTMMPVGSKWVLYIPQELAYGSRNAGKIQPYSALIFEVELLGIEK